MIEILSYDNFGHYKLTSASAYAWSTRQYQPPALRRIWTWGITKDGQGWHHLSPTPQPWDMRQTKVTSNIDQV